MLGCICWLSYHHEMIQHSLNLQLSAPGLFLPSINSISNMQTGFKIKSSFSLWLGSHLKRKIYIPAQWPRSPSLDGWSGWGCRHHAPGRASGSAAACCTRQQLQQCGRPLLQLVCRTDCFYSHSLYTWSTGQRNAQYLTKQWMNRAGDVRR